MHWHHILALHTTHCFYAHLGLPPSRSEDSCSTTWMKCIQGIKIQKAEQALQWCKPVSNRMGAWFYQCILGRDCRGSEDVDWNSTCLVGLPFITIFCRVLIALVMCNHCSGFFLSCVELLFMELLLILWSVLSNNIWQSTQNENFWKLTSENGFHVHLW